MNKTRNRATIAILGAILIFASLIALFGYPLLILTAVVAAFVALAAIVLLSAGDMIDKSSRPAAQPSRRTGTAAV